VHTLNSISAVSEFFQIVQGIYKFITNSQNRYELYVEVQKQKTKQEIIFIKKG